jgi:hypothetical protein
MSQDLYAYWDAALEGQFGAVTEIDPQAGFYKLKSAGGFWLPVALWWDEHLLWAKVGNEDDPVAVEDAEDRVRDIWLRCARQPVTEAAYRHAIATSAWPGGAPAVRGMGDNRGPEGLAGIAAMLAEQSAEMRAWLQGRTIESAADADRCERWANDFLTIKKQAEAEHKVEKEPHLKAGREVDARYKPLIDLAATCARALKEAATAYLLARHAEKQAAAAQAIARGDSAPVRADMRATTSGNSGRKLALRTHKWAEVHDWDAAIHFFQDHPELRELVQRLADKCAQVGAPVPGVTFKSEQRAA